MLPRVLALAGCGKTSTLHLIAAAYPELTFLFTASRKAAVADAQLAFLPNVVCATTHKLAEPIMQHVTAQGKKIGYVYVLC